MKKNLLLIMMLLPLSGLQAQTAKFDTAAVLILDRMSDFIGELNSCKYTLSVSRDIPDPLLGISKEFAVNEVVLVGPNKISVNRWSDEGHHSFLCNGESMVLYSHSDNNYAMVETPGNIMETVDLLSKNYELDLPGSDFFFPSFTDDLIETFDEIRYAGKVWIDGQQCLQINCSSKTMNTIFWINNDAYNLPVRYLIYYNQKKGNPQFEGTFSNWEINLEVPNSMFNFTAPPGSHQVKLLEKRSSSSK